MKIKNIHGLSAADLQEQVKKGGRFVFFPFTISLILVTFKRTSGVYLVRKQKEALVRSIPFTVISLLFGWWGLPFGPKYTFENIRTNINGGKEVTDEVMATVAGYVLFQEAEEQRNSVL